MNRRKDDAQGRLDDGPPIAVVDIGSNSVRLVAYEGLTRSPTPLFNEKALCGLGREVQSTGLLAPTPSSTRSPRSGATARCAPPWARKRRWASPRPPAATPKRPRFRQARRKNHRGATIDVLSGGREAELTALGVISGVHRADGVVGDLGGGSLELVDVHGTRVRHGLTRPLGGLALADISARSVKKAEKFVKKTLAALPVLKGCEHRNFYAVGGTWRSLGRLHMRQTGYPLHVMHGYAIPADEALEFASLSTASMSKRCRISKWSTSARRPLLPYAALVLEHILRIGKPRQVVFSALGVREGLLYSLLKKRKRKRTR